MPIKISNLNSKSNGGSTYIDLHFDLQANNRDGGKSLPSNIVEGNDIIVDADTSALRNSMVNLMSTQKGDRPLLLGFGLDLYKFIGEPITERTGKLIAKEIQRSIGFWEPRVELKQIYIIPNPDALMYELIIVLRPIFLTNNEITLTGNLAQEKGFKFVEEPLTFQEKINK